MPNNGIYDDKKSINGANPINLLIFKPFAIIMFFIVVHMHLSLVFSFTVHP